MKTEKAEPKFGVKIQKVTEKAKLKIWLKNSKKKLKKLN